ncbi:MAG: putative ribosomal RNA small subunit methyltransferase A [Methanonatronarchaeales archaeon]|nr:putative ribosomal RNA small subunit methyltransferase A [Methanonatronarchaeales archaeon]
MPRRPPRDQHFLIDERVADRIAGYAELSGDERVLEIGGGTGVLTGRLVDRCAELTVVEVDGSLASGLEKRYPSAKVVHGDALDVEYPDFDVCVSNLPYSVSSGVTFRLLEHDFDRAVLMYQREFAERLLAEPGTKEYGRLTVAVNLYSSVEHLEDVPRAAFRPRPRVDSSVVLLRRRAPPYEVRDEELLLNLLRAVFTQRRKKTRNGLLNTLHMTGLDEERVNSLDADTLERRPEDLSPAEFAGLSNQLA